MVSMPDYLTYEKMYEMSPLAGVDAFKQLDLAKQFAQEGLVKDQLANEQAGLKNLYDTQTLPSRVQQQKYTTEGLGITNRQNAVKADIAEATKPFALDAEKQKLIRQTSDDEYKVFENSVYKNLGSPDPAVREQAKQLFEMLPEIRKIRTTGEENRKTDDQRTANDIKLENTRAANAQARDRARQAAVAQKASQAKNMNTDQLQAFYLQASQEAMTKGDIELAQYYYNYATTVAQQRALSRPDPRAGQPDAAAIANLPAVAPREAPPMPTPPRPAGLSTQPPVVRDADGKPVFANKPQHTMADVKQMYPGKSEQQIREAYKKKFGVDLQ